jgi:hypothetical protein
MRWPWVKPESVQAIAGVMPVENAARSLVVTTSRFLPTSKKFAARMPNRLELKTPSDVAEWCKVAANRIVKDKSQLVSDDNIRGILHEFSGENRNGKVVVSTHGYNCTLVDFALVLKETKNAALLMRIPFRIVEGDFQVGSLVPVLDATILGNRNKDHVFRARRTEVEHGTATYWGKRQGWHVWDGKPQYQNAMD